MSLVDDIREREAESTAGGMLRAVLAGVRGLTPDGPPRPMNRDELLAADAAAKVEASIHDARRRNDAWKRGNDGLLD